MGTLVAKNLPSNLLTKLRVRRKAFLPLNQLQLYPLTVWTVRMVSTCTVNSGEALIAGPFLTHVAADLSHQNISLAVGAPDTPVLASLDVRIKSSGYHAGIAESAVAVVVLAFLEVFLQLLPRERMFVTLAPQTSVRLDRETNTKIKHTA